MAYLQNPLLPDDLQKKENFQILVEDESGQLINITEMVEKIGIKVNSKLDQNLLPTNAVLITSPEGKIVATTGVVMQQAERDKLANLTDSMVFKGIKNSEADLPAVAENGWVYFVQAGDAFLQYCKTEEGWVNVGAVNRSVGRYYDRSDGVKTAVGGLAKGTKIFGKTYDEILTEMFYPETPLSASFATTATITIGSKVENLNFGKVYEIGSTPTIQSVKYTKSAGDRSVSSYKIYTNSSKTQQVSGVTYSGDTAAFGEAGVGLKAFYAEVSDGKTNVGKGFSVTLVNPMFWGMLNSATPNATMIKALGKQIVAKGAQTAYFTGSNKFVCFAYPASYGELKSIVDVKLGYEYLNGFKKFYLQNVDLDGRTDNYNVYVQQNATTLNNFGYIFKF